ncbi:basement membrane-specific heparan sulfate proteoglycan core protein [Macrobrachium rosenbergii]|uniref:basement membrane-specific heparan sulfate proteoglycan core protein n=1 Tax=Macrobrachium rosenbergii TaxID=79674 RepID=UPI0034D69D1E
MYAYSLKQCGKSGKNRAETRQTSYVLEADSGVLEGRKTDEDLIFEEEGIMRTRRDIEVAPVEAPLPEEQPSFLTRVRRQFSFLGFGSNAPTDDEDEIGSAGEEGSGGEQLRIYRAKVHVVKDWRPSLGNMNSPDFVALARDLERNLEVALRRISGDKTVKVSSMRRSDPGKILATVDINYMGWSDETEAMRRAIRSVLDSQYLGTIPVNSQFFSFEEPKAARPSCPAGQHRCPSGRCVKRCDGRAECLDGSDELNCVVEVDVVPTSGITSGSAAHDGGGCPGDDQFTCVDGYVICRDQRCDSQIDCPQGDDEEACDCEEGFFQCDAVRCLSNNQKCDGRRDCMDNTDEEGCPTSPSPYTDPTPPTCRSDDQGPNVCRDGRTFACFCDGKVECPDGGDEDDCPYTGCETNELSCDDGTSCIQESKQCDGVEDCFDGTDEKNCPSVVPCGRNQYQCKTGECIDDFRHCDYMKDCPGGEDEEFCPCKPDEYECNSGQCVGGNKRCDGVPDCDDETDETVGCPCDPSSFTCRNGQCVDLTVRCDGEPDCDDQSDEHGCPACSSGAFLCGNNQCIPEENVCDGNEDCDTDELNCCEGSGMFECDSGDTCLSEDRLCDGVNDCSDGFDESQCPGEWCPEGKYMCKNGDCIDIAYRCDGLTQCQDQSDEIDCPCGPDQWRCRDGLCIPKRSRCNRYFDCPDYSDEENCQPACRPTEWTCRDGSCIPGDAHCNGYPDCRDGSDEEDCPRGCNSEEWTCRDGSCVALNQRCDGEPQCLDRSDEENCPPNACSPGEWTCLDGSCIPEEKRCDRYYDCPDYTDEAVCPPTPACSPGEWTCKDESCIPEDRRCDGRYDCPDYTDEDDCSSVCGPNEWSCRDGSCIPLDAHCDQVYHCIDRSDEENCALFCDPGKWKCGDGSCILLENYCNGVPDCPDYSDEEDCVEECRSDEWRCLDGTCIRQENHCDGTPHCLDRSDEENCARPCGPSEWTCRDKSCIPLQARCDSQYDCRDYSDEENCPACGPGEWRCSDGSCIPAQERCDRQFDCRDYSDEDNCPACRPGEWSCRDGSCIPVQGRCDRQYDCRDYSDEENCPVCGPGEWSCKDGSCIPLQGRCDNQYNCRDYSDEQDCPEGCRPGEWRCVDGTCIPQEYRCDQIPQCLDRSDEENCGRPRPCGRFEWTCRDGSCIPLQARCDNFYHCRDYSDEDNCPDRCRPREWRCLDGTCIPEAYHCDGVPQCLDRSDEENCVRSCMPSEWTCRDGSCIPLQTRCDNRYDCRDYSDEENCAEGCRPDEWRCSDGNCIPRTYRCDRIPQCLDHSDEEGCARPRPCPPGQWTCRADGSCIPFQARCDNIYDCSDYSDEAGCQACGSDQWTCRDGSCIPIQERCDNWYNCRDFSDEENCQVCRSDEWTCRDRTCVPDQAVCNGYYDCPDYSDEDGCQVVCGPGEWRCRDGACIPLDNRCDRTPHCIDRSDEENCPLIECAFDEYTCKDDSCIPLSGLCNGASECPDGSDEIDCKIACRPGEWQCGDGTCIRENQRCNGQIDCRDYTDENECAPTCLPEEFSCLDDGTCIPRELVCDGRDYCRDGSDELNCPTPATCSENEFRCADGICISGFLACDGQEYCHDGSDEWNCLTCNPATLWQCNDGICIDRVFRCDGKQDCPNDNSDEYLCIPLATPRPNCTEGEFRCNDGTCISSASRCNGEPDCGDSEDELKCPPELCRPPEGFRCSSGYCIQAKRRCDGTNDCQDTSDERDCPPSCTNNEFTCGDGSCIPLEEKCNGLQNCPDGKDEANCPSDCRHDQFRCEDNSCIELSQRCNGRAECLNGEDERGCPCSPDEFRCQRDGQCIDSRKQCDGRNDCSDGSDELNCRCPAGEWRCLNGQCIPSAYRCDGRQDCSDRSDETVECPPPPPRPPAQPCDVDQFECRNGRCISRAFLCDGIPDCTDGSDEINENCRNKSEIRCRSDQFSCSSGECVGLNKRCNGHFDCVDASDETGCPKVERECTGNEFRCTDGVCISSDWKCDNVPDCSDGSDETGCVTPCKQTEYQCGDGTCIPESERCDGIFDCADQSDERDNCCHSDEFQCRNGDCIPSSQRCNGYPECVDHSDEHECSCGSIEWRCDSGDCIFRTEVCNGVRECSDGSDERDCPDSSKPCYEGQFRCSTGECIENSRLCDGNDDCEEGQDETFCHSNFPSVTPVIDPETPVDQCTSSEFTCGSGECISSNVVCDGRFDCTDGSDERENCVTADPVVTPRQESCTVDQFKCRNGFCIDQYQLCDGRQDCSDGSDEDNCGPRCQPYEFQCRGGRCISRNARCDGRRDCLDGSDEIDCLITTPYTPFTPPTPTPSAASGPPPPRNYFICKDGGFIENFRRCDGRRDCNDGSDEDERCKSQTDTIDLKTYPDEQTIQQTREVVFQCRDEGTIRAPVRWTRDGNRPMPPGTTDVRGRLTIPNVQVEHSGRYYCEAQGVPLSTPGRTKPVNLQVIPYVRPTPPTLPPVCRTNEATCMNGQCIPRTSVCNGVFDCDDASDEMRCNPLGCEPNEYQCDNKRCVLKTWMCDSDDDCGDGSDERNCVTNPPGSPCLFNEFTCHIGNQCIPKSFHCDNEVDCQDDSDETGCSKPLIITPPPRNLMVQAGETFVINCTAIGVPQPTVIWRLNWGHVPDKCRMTSVDGVGVLTCPSAQPTDQGAYSCEALNSRGSVFATPDCIVQVKGGASVCQIPYFNALAQSQQDCLKCFCFGATEECYSADRYITQLPPPTSSSFQLVGVNQDQFQGNYVIRNRQYPISTSFIRYPGGNDVQLLGDRSKIGGPRDLLIYFSLPDSHKGQQLSSYGGYLRYKIAFSSSGTLQQHSGPDVIMVGNNITLMHVHDGEFLPNVANQVDVRLTPGHWFKRVIGRGPVAQTQEPASREEIMMVLENIEFLLIRALYHDESFVDAKLSEVQLDTSVMSNSGQGQAIYVEECRCPEGYVGLSCQSCAPSYKRVREGPWLGRCVRDAECRPGEYGDPANGIPCQRCPCPLSSPTNQFSSSCYLDTDGQVTCNCLRGYTGRRCERCSEGYKGNPLTPGESCQPVVPKCKWYEFYCGDMSRCIDKERRCDGRPDCPDGSDEDYCYVRCVTTFTCSDGTVHPWSRRCDGIKDCLDYEDEKECNVCFNSGHRCGDGHCVHFERICDGHSDCRDLSDELPQNCLDALPCDHIHQWTCADPTRQCIDRSRHCDRVVDCPDGSDELYCNCTCDKTFNFLCNDGLCLDSSVRCNGRFECPDRSDEIGCGCDPRTEFTCSNGDCIDNEYYCDGRYNCRDGSDEPFGCNHCDLDIMHQCGDRTCIDKRYVCNGLTDCTDGSDEPWDCTPCNLETMHRCGNGTCISKHHVCNGRRDCSDGSDEPPSCVQYCDDRYEFACRTGTCIDLRLVCNGYNDCWDGSDEERCSHCNQYEFQCGDGSCISRQHLCDGRSDCRDGSDESERGGCCVAPYFFQCLDGGCIDSRLVCNRKPDCRDGSDEHLCSGECNPAGSYSSSADPATGSCQCKEFVTGPKCDTCIQNSFYLNENNRYGCIDCFCMGITEQCTSSNWYRQQESVSFTNDRQGFELVDKFQQNVISNDIYVDSGRQELVFQEFSRLGQEVYYWKLPQRFLGDKVTSYGGNLTYSLRYVPTPGGQSSANAAAAVEIYGNDIVLKHYSRSQLSPSRQETVSVPLYEQYWERQDGQEANREHFLMALADLEYILIKATYTTNTGEVGLKEVILDYAEPRNTGQERAFAVEMCECPVGYQGLSCEDCAIGYTRSLSGLHLGTCIPCECNDHSEECDPEDGICTNCRDNTAGDFCDECALGFNRDASGRCIRIPGGECNCDVRGSVSTQCYGEHCQCKKNVQGEDCDSCKPGYFHLSSQNPDGCLECWCSGVSSQCFSSNYFRTQLPMQLLSDHGFMLANRLRSNVIKDGFNINVANNEISFSNFGALRDGETYYWSLPQMFTGNRLPSYGGNLTITQRYQAQSGGNQYADPDVIIRSSGGRELIWMNNRPLQPNILQTYVVPLFEENFTMNQQPASRADFLNALSSVEAVLVRATVSNRMTSTFLRDVIMDTAVSSQTGQPRAYAVEQCQCPKEYSGLSCEQCKPGYYRDTATNQCNQCPCNGREESCALRPDGRVRCDCLPGYHGDFCEESGLMLELRPMKVLFSHNFRERYANFTCSYHSSEPLRVVFTLEPALAKGETPFALMATNSPYNTERYTSGAKHYVTLRILRGHKTVTCRVYDASNMEVAQMVSQILYVSRARRERPPPGGDPSSATISVTVSEPSIVISAVGSTVQFHCSARTITDQRRVPVTWSKLDGVLPYARSSDNRQGLLEITQIQPSDSGVYICTASDGYIVFTQNATLRVQGETAQPGAPRVRIEEPREVVEVRRGQTLEVRCSAAGSPRPQVTWSYGPNRDRLPFNVFAQNGVLIFRSAQTDVSGEYYCTASNSQGTDYARIIINIVPDDRAPVPSPIPGGPLVVQVSREIVEVRSGETVRVSCTAAIPRSVTITWSRLAGPLPSQAVVANGELQIVNARPVDSGIYVCRITDDRTSRYEESSTRITVTEYVNLPSVSIQPDRQTINQGTNAELRCIATGTPAPIITWSKANEELGPRVTVDGSILRITDAVVSDRGMYVCSARNDGGTAQAASIVEVERREPPVIEIYPEVKQTIVVGASALFQCHLTAGIPPPSVRWTRTDGRPLKPNTEVLNGGVLRFNEVKGDEEGSYTCTAENDAGSVKAVAILEIQSLPFITIQPRPSPYRVRVGQRVRLECSAQGDPAPTVSWQKLQHNFPANIPSQSALPTVAVYEIASATRADEGTYQCSARNAAGTSEERLQLIIEEEDHIQPPPYYDNWPTQPAYPQRPEQESRYSVPRGGSFELRCAGGSDRESTQIDFKRTDDAPLPRGHRIQGGVLYLNNVDDSAAGEYVCIGSDRISGSILFTIYSYIQVLGDPCTPRAPPRITLDPRRQVVRPGDHTRIHCSATGDQPITINWSKQGGYMPPSVIINGGEMMFRGISTSDAGQYICEAVNSAGSSEAVAEVVVNATDDGERLVITSVSLPQLKTENENQPEVNANEDKDGIFFYQLGDEDSIDASSAPSDGYFLSMPEEVVCHFVCHNATNCITATQLCDGIADCLDGSDEWNCLADGLLKTCPESPCGDKRCIGEHMVCDGIPDCKDAADEENCVGGDIFNTENKCLDFFKCGDGSCYPFYLNCDGHCDCNDCKDEKVCFRRRRQVTKEEPLLTAIQRDVLMYTGQTAELRCEVSGLTPSIVQWRRIGGSLPPGALPRGNLLRLPFIKVEDTGRYMCEARTPDGFLTSDVITLTVERSQAIPVRIEPSHRNVRIGEDIVLSCTVDGDPAAAVTWSRIGKYLPPNAQERGNQLWITNVQADNGGVYRCSVTTQNGVFDESYPLVIQDTISTENLNYTDVNTRSVKTRSVPYGTGVVMECYVSIPPPVSYTWSKQGGELPVRAHVQGATIDIPEVHTEDAGLYICTGSNNERSVDLLTLLVVTGVIPRFSGSSYITLPTLPRAYLTFDLDISFKPESDNGLILYNSQRAGSEDGDFVSFGMSGGHAEFRFDVGSGPAVIRSRAPLELNAWHTVRLSRNRKEGTMVVDDGVPVTGRSEGRFLGLDLVENMYLGSVPDFSKVQKQSGFNTGFRGCISRLVIGKTVTVDLMRDAKSKVDVGACETCAGNPCKNSGVCQEAYTETGHKCICPAGFSGGLCENTGEACYPGVCGTGRCVNKPGGFECFCPFGKVGERCERDITIVEPAFGDGAYIAYPTPKALRRFSVDMNFKPESLEDGVLMYCAQRESGEGDFTSLAIRNKRLEFRFNTGSGTALIQSDPLQQDQWVEVRANRTDRLGSMSINGGQMQNTESPGTNRGLNLVTPLFIGGVDNSRIEISPEVSVNQGFHGCVKEIKLMDQEMRLADSLVDSANVGQCGGSSASMCTLNSCNNRGQCIDNPALPHGYTCNCIDGYSGHNCEVEPGVCSIIQPCRNGGACIGSGDVYSCRCPLGFAGQHCEHDVQVLGSASFSGDSWVEFDRSMLPQEGGETQKITFEFSTVKSEGLLFWLGQEAGIPGRGQDYVSVAIVDGFVEFAYQLGTGPAFVRSRNRVNDGERHTLIVKRTGRQGSIELDGSVHEYGESPGMLHMLNTRGNIYIGGVPDLQLMTDGTHTVGFQGCIHQLTIGEEKIVNYMRLAVSGINVTRCPRYRKTTRREAPHRSSIQINPLGTNISLILPLATTTYNTPSGPGFMLTTFFASSASSSFHFNSSLLWRSTSLVFLLTSSTTLSH